MYEAFQKILDERGITAYKVAKDCGFSVSILYDWKAGRSRPGLRTAVKIAKYLDVPVTALVEE